MQVSCYHICVICYTCQGTFYPDYTAKAPWLDQTLRRPGFFTQRQRPTRGEGFDSWARKWGNGASATIHSLTYQTSRRRERQPCYLFRFILSQRIERAMEVLLQDCTGPWRAHATKLYGVFLLSLSTTKPYDDDDDDDDGCCCWCCCYCYFYILSSLTYYTLTSTATETTLAPNSRHTIFISSSTHGNHIYLHRGKFFHPPHSWQHCFFQTSRPFFSNLPPSFKPYRHLSNPPPSFKHTAGGEGGHVTKKVEGVILLLRKFLPPPAYTSPITTYIGLTDRSLVFRYPEHVRYNKAAKIRHMHYIFSKTIINM